MDVDCETGEDEDSTLEIHEDELVEDTCCSGGLSRNGYSRLMHCHNIPAPPHDVRPPSRGLSCTISWTSTVVMTFD